MLVNFLKGPLGMAVMGSVITVGTAVTGVTAGPSVAKAVTERVNATPAPATGWMSSGPKCMASPTARCG